MPGKIEFNINRRRRTSQVYVPRARCKKQMTFTTLLKGVKVHKRGYEFEEPIHNRYRCTLATSQKVRLDRTREVVDESHIRCLLCESLEGQCNERAGMAPRRKRRDLQSFKVVDADWTLFTGSGCGDDTAKGSSLLKERQKVDNKSIAGVC